MNNIEFLYDALGDKILMQSMYNKYMMKISKPEVRQLFTQLRELKMKNILLL